MTPDGGYTFFVELLGGDHADFVRVGEIEIAFAVNLAAKADLQDTALLQKTFLEGAAKGRAVGILAAEIFVPKIVVGIELDKTNGSMLLRNRAKEGKADGVIPADADAPHCGVVKSSHSLLDALKGVFDGKRIDAQVAEVRDAVFGKRVHLQNRIPRTNNRGLRAHVAWPETRTGAIGGAAVKRDADQRDFQLFGLGNMRQTHESRDAGEARVGERVGRLGVRQTKGAAGLGHEQASEFPETGEVNAPSRHRRSLTSE